LVLLPVRTGRHMRLPDGTWQPEGTLLDVQRASEATGELIFAKPDHVGVQAFRPCAILDAPDSSAGLGSDARPDSQTTSPPLSRRSIFKFREKD
jgi:hypothetical protein